MIWRPLAGTMFIHGLEGVLFISLMMSILSLASNTETESYFFMRGWMEIKIIFERVTDGEQNSAEWSRCVVLSVLLRLQT